MNQILLLGTGLGLLAGFGLLLAFVRIPVFRKPRLDDRLAPYVRDAAMARPFTDRTFTPFPTLERILRPYTRRATVGLERALGGGVTIRRKLQQAGSDLTLEEFRVEQLIWGAMGFLAGIGFSILLLATGDTNPLMLLLVCGVAFIGGITLRDRRLTTAVHKREQQMIAEFPTIADMLALSVTAGEGPIAALERVAKISKGELAKEFNTALSEARTGASLIEALEGISERTSVAALARFIDGMAVSVERGTPLADVLRAQAADARETGKRALMESGGKKEIGMMVPVVFLVLPITILFALYPGVIGITMLTG